MSESERGDEGFLGRWSRRKHADAEENIEEELQLDDAEAPLNELEVSAEEDVVEVIELTDEDMPPIESLTEDSDYSGFLSPKVSAELRKMALRKLFGLSMFNVRDGLDDYDDDFTSFEKLGDIIPAEMKYRIEKEAERLRADAESSEDGIEEMDDAEEILDDEELTEEGVIEDIASEESIIEQTDTQSALAEPATTVNPETNETVIGVNS